jgi:hypothetical protein
VFPSSPTAGLNTGRIPHLQTWDNAISRFLKAWNEWAEGNYLEPDRETGWAYLDAIRRVVVQPMFRPESTAASITQV